MINTFSFSVPFLFLLKACRTDLASYADMQLTGVQKCTAMQVRDRFKEQILEHAKCRRDLKSLGQGADKVEGAEILG